MKRQDSGIQTQYNLDEYLTRLLHSNVIGIICSELTGKVVDANDAFLGIIGYSREELQSGQIDWMQLTPPEYAIANDVAVQQVTTQGFASPFQKEYIHKDGHRVPVTVGVTSIDSQLCLAYVIDHTEHREVQKRLADSEQTFKMLTEAIPQLVWTAGDFGKCEYGNRRYLEYTGIDPAAEDGLAWHKFVHPDDLPYLIERSNASTNESVFHGEIRFRHVSGAYRWQLVRAEKCRMADGSLKWIGTCTDIDNHKRIEENLREAMARFRTLAEAIPQIVWIANPSGDIIFFNSRWFEYSGLNHEQSMSGGWKLLIHPDDVENYVKSWTAALASGDTFEYKFRLKRAVGMRASGGGYREHLCRAVASQGSSGGIIEWFGTWTDID